jgi:Ca2+/H+ antiporter
LIIALMALNKGLIGVVKASITGSIIGGATESGGQRSSQF